jgi:uncharacterized membrane protein
MDDLKANQIVFLILIFIIVGILFILNIFTKAYVWGAWLNRMKNNSGNYNAGKIIMMLLAALALYFLLTWMFSPKITTRASQSRSKEEPMLY